MSPTERTLKLLRERGWAYAKCEYFNPWVKIRQDLFGLFDYIALDDKQGVCGVQISSYGDIKKHIVKMEANPILKEWVKRGNRALVIGWRETTDEAGKKIFVPREVYLTETPYNAYAKV